MERWGGGLNKIEKNVSFTQISHLCDSAEGYMIVDISVRSINYVGKKGKYNQHEFRQPYSDALEHRVEIKVEVLVIHYK